MRMAIRCLVVLALIAAFGAIDVGPGLAQGNGNADNGCVTGNPSQGSECNGGPNDNQGKPGGGVGCAGGSNAPRSEPCGRADGDGTLNNQGNVPGCTSQGNAVNQNPHCGGGDVPPPPPPPPCKDHCTPPPPDGCVTKCEKTPTVGGVVVKALPSTGISSAAGQQDSSVVWLLLAAVSALAAGLHTQRRHST